jgi:hypothetical protein
MKNGLVCAAILSFLLLSQAALAIGIGPGRIEVKFVPNLNTNYTFHVANSQDRPLKVQPFVSGDLAQYITVGNDAYTLGSNEVRNFMFQVSLPASLEPGRRDTNIGVVEVTPPGGMVSAVAGVQLQFWVYVDYPEKYVSVDITYSEPELGKPMVFDVKLFNPVNRTLQTSADLDIIEIRNGTDITLERFDFGNATLNSGDERIFHASWAPQKEGNYKAVVHAYYEGETTRKEMGFNIVKPQAPPASTPQTPQQIVKKAAQNLLYSPYTAVVIILVLAIIIVALWPEKKKEADA